MTDPKSKSSLQGARKTLRDQVLLKVGERLLNSETVREVVKKEVLRSVGQAASKAVTGKGPAPSGKPAPSNLVGTVAEVWGHPAVQGAVKGGLKNAGNRARLWRDQARQRVDERQDEQLAKRAQRGADLSPEDAVLLAQRRAERERVRRQLAQRERLLVGAQDIPQRQVLELLCAHTPWLGGQAAPLRYTQLLDTLAPDSSATREMAYHRALWTLAESKVLAVSPHGEIALLPLSNEAAEEID